MNNKTCQTNLPPRLLLQDTVTEATSALARQKSGWRDGTREEAFFGSFLCQDKKEQNQTSRNNWLGIAKDSAMHKMAKPLHHCEQSNSYFAIRNTDRVNS